MHTVLPTGEFKGVLRVYDFAPRDKRPTTNYGRMGTIPFIALKMVEYRHDSESVIWVLAYITLANVEYNKITPSRHPGHQLQVPGPTGSVLLIFYKKKTLFLKHSTRLPVAESYEQYSTIVRGLVKYWVGLFYFGPSASTKPEDDDPKDTLERLIEGVEKELGEEAKTAFTKVKALLLEAIESLKVMYGPSDSYPSFICVSHPLATNTHNRLLCV